MAIRLLRAARSRQDATWTLFSSFLSENNSFMCFEQKTIYQLERRSFIGADVREKDTHGKRPNHIIIITRSILALINAHVPTGTVNEERSCTAEEPSYINNAS